MIIKATEYLLPSISSNENHEYLLPPILPPIDGTMILQLSIATVQLKMKYLLWSAAQTSPIQNIGVWSKSAHEVNIQDLLHLQIAWHWRWNGSVHTLSCPEGTLSLWQMWQVVASALYSLYYVSVVIPVYTLYSRHLHSVLQWCHVMLVSVLQGCFKKWAHASPCV